MSDPQALKARLADLSAGFRERFLDYDELTTQMTAWANEFPDLVRVRSIGETEEGRSLWLMEIGPEPDRIRPAVWVDGNMHAAELCGSSVALGIAEDVIGLHLWPDDPDAEIPRPVADRVRDILFYVLPRMSPDGAEQVLRTGQYVRSVPRDHRANRNHARWVSGDIDGDGVSLLMRVQDPAGEFIESDEVAGLMLVREIDDAGPYYKLYPEGSIENFDGHHIPSPSFLSDNQTDLNRNFPWSWAPEHDQVGAGSFPLSEPESRAVVEESSSHPNTFLWLNLHTFGGVFIRPLGHLPDTKMDQEDLALFRQIGAWAEEHTGYPMVSGFEEFVYEPDKPLHGDLTDYAYHQRGCIAYVIELWDLFNQLGWKRRKRFVDAYTHFDRADMVALGKWDREHNQSRVIVPWRQVEHPQLGKVEVGGVDPRVGLWNPPYERIDEVCRSQSRAFLRVAALAPRVVVECAETTAIGESLTRVTVTAKNLGYLPTYVLSSAKKLDFNEPLYATASAEGCTLDDPAQAHVEVGHLDGWGRGKHDGTGALYYMRSRGTTGERTLSYVVRGSGTLRVRVGACRTGWVERVIEVA